MNKIFLVTLLVFSLSSHSQVFLNPGDIAPLVNITDYLKNEPKDKSLAGKYVVIDFWATWCASCLAGVPDFNKVAQKYKSRKDVVFLSMTYESPKLTKHVLDRVDFQTTVVSDRSRKTFRDFGLEDGKSISVPQLVLIDKSNKIYFIDYASEDLDKLMERFLNGKPGDVPVDSAVGIQKPAQPFVNPHLDLQQQLIMGSEFMFTITDELDKDGSSGSMDALSMGKSGYFNRLLQDVFDDVYKDSGRVVLPESLGNKRFSVLYRNPERLTVEEHKAMIKKLLLSHFKMTEKTKMVSSNVFYLRAKDPTKLVLSESKEPHSGNTDIHLIAGGPISNLIEGIFSTDKIVVIDQTELTGDYEFLLDRSKGIDGYAASLESYGLALQKEKTEIQTTFLE